MRTHYDNLHVSEKAAPEVIKGAYKALAQKWHPDKHPGQREKAERYFKIITRAFEVLSDPKTRAKYDAWLADSRNAAEPPPDAEPVNEPPKQSSSQSNMADAWEDGKRSREQGFKETDCPYSQPELTRAWQDGFRAGTPTPASSPSSFHPWRRFFARFIDVPLALIATFAAIFLVAKVLQFNTGKDFYSDMQNSGATFLIFFALTVIAYEAYFIEKFSATPGKLVFGISVTSRTGEKLGTGKAILRSIYANVIGQGIHIPLFAAIANIAGLVLLRKTGSTYWDNQADSVVQCQPMSKARTISAILAVVVAMILYAIVINIIDRLFQ